MVSVATLKEAKAVAWQQNFDAVLLDLSLPDSQGLETINRLSAAAPNLPIVVLTGEADEAVAREAVRSGARLSGQRPGRRHDHRPRDPLRHRS